MKEIYRELAICQMNCAAQFYTGGGMDIDTFIIENSLNTKIFLNLAKTENMIMPIIEAIERNI